MQKKRSCPYKSAGNWKRKSHFPVAYLAFPLALFGCGDRSSNSGSINSETSGAATSLPATDQWLGQWTGPEGTFLRLEGGNGRYTITIQNLDGPRTYAGSAIGAQIQFERNNVMEFIQATNGVETGMKWLADKSDCLTVRPGEGYCRD
jgi:hypothetical protein